MGAYKSRPIGSCADEWKRQFSESCRQLRASLIDDTTTIVRPSETIEWSALLRACTDHDVDLVKDLTSSTENGLTALHLCVATKCQIEMMIVLLQKGAKTCLLSDNGFSALHLATFKGLGMAVEVLCKNSKETINQRGKNGVTALHLAAMEGNNEIAKLLLLNGADPNASDVVGFSPLHFACFYGHESTIDLLLSRGAHINLLGEVGDTPLHLACYKGHRNVVEALLSRGDAGIVDRERNSLLHLCCQYGHQSLVELLLRVQPVRYAQLQNLYGDTPMHLACYAGHLDVVKRLVECSGLDSLVMENIFSETPLHAASTGGHLALVEYLLDLPDGVVLNRQGRDGHTALHSACYHGHYTLVELLLDRGADPTLLAQSTDENDDDYDVNDDDDDDDSNEYDDDDNLDLLTDTTGKTCADWAYEKGYDDIVSLIKSKLQPPQKEEHSNEHSYRNDYFLRLPVPSPLGRLRSITREKADVLRLRSTLHNNCQIQIQEIELLNLIGTGSFGKVFKGKCRDEIVAVKKYRSSSFSAKSDTDMFCREVSVLCSLNHPNVVDFIGACLEDPSQFVIVTEYVPGGSLYAILHEQKRALDLHLKLGISVDVARGMRYLHELPQPIMHRDLNSHNILLREDCTAVVADFGESRFLKSVDDDNLTKQPGNLRWMAPEIFNQSTCYSIHADIFSYALCVWELFSGELPFEHLKPAAAAADMACRNKRPRFSGSFPRQVAQIVERAWHSQPDQRPSFFIILEHLEPLLDATDVPPAYESGDDVFHAVAARSLPQSPILSLHRTVSRSGGGVGGGGSSSNSSGEGKRSDNRIYSTITTSHTVGVGAGPGIPTQNPAVAEELVRRLSLVTDKNGYVSDPFATRRLSSSRKKSHSDNS
ncbi:serine/threonine-protein kinase TNNI3K-like [Oscarella lobularis]|uniref:serine/threonine-protein kinase TNNI3K-like n=1 Tax=Oscarella lobularis TaxID=121494 RepID=UPI003313C7A9